MLATFLFPINLATAQPEAIVTGSAARPEIERILKADNLDIEHLTPSEVAEHMRTIRQGAAPTDFWRAYQAHVRAWNDYAAALAASAARAPGEPAPSSSEWAIGEARTRINRTFDAVELIARRRGATVPLPRTRL